MTKRLLAAALATGLLTSCFAGDEVFMASGAYQVLIVAVNDDSCQYGYQEGATGMMDITADDLLLTVHNPEGEDISFDRVDNSYMRSFDETIEVDPPCFLDVEFEEVITPDSSISFTFTSSGHEQTEGDCSVYDTSAYPCSYDVTFQGALVE